jgi:enoyl-CoA hydratase/carnithine racemase
MGDMAEELGRADEAVRYEVVDEHVAIVTLNRPEKRNAVNAAVANGLEAAVRRSEADPKVRAVLLASSSTVFSAGADLAEVAAGRGASINTADGGFAGLVYAARSKPWIAVVEGPAFAGGFEICLACDMIVASKAAMFGLQEVKRGLVPGAGGAHRLAQRIPPAIALEIIATAEPIDAPRAAALGLVNRLTEPGQALAEARALAAAVAANAPLAVQTGLDLVKRAADCDDAQGRALADAAIAKLRQTEDYKEGVGAFLEKRPPVWKAR